MQLLTERYNNKIQGVIACYDRVVIHVVPEADSPRRRTLPGFNYADGMTSFLKARNIRIEGSRIKHHMGSAAIKMYNKHGLILRIETTANDISFFKHYRKVEQRDGSITRKYAHMRKNIYSPRPSLS